MVSSQGPLVAISDQFGTSPGNMLAHTACQGDFHEGPTACFQKLPSVEPLKNTAQPYDLFLCGEPSLVKKCN